MEELSKADIKFSIFLEEWAISQGMIFDIESFDGREDFIDGMAVDDVWGWLLKSKNEPHTDDNFGVVEWSVNDGVVKLEWHSASEYLPV